MADTKISGLTALTGANTASGDLLTIVDVSDTTMAATGTNKKITLTELQSAPVSAGTANGVLYLNGSKVATAGTALTFDGTNLTVPANVQSGGNPVFYSYNGGAAGTVRAGIQMVGTDPSVRFTVNGSEQMRLTSTGLGIGTSSPGVKLDTVGVMRSTFNSTSSGGPGSHGLELRQSTTSTKALIAGYSTSGNQTGAYIQAVNFGTAYEDLVIQPQGGNLGIGTSSPATKLDVNGDGTFRNGSGVILGNIQNSSGWYDFKGSGNTNGTQISSATALPIRFVINGSEVSRFDSSGNLLVGTTSVLLASRLSSVGGASQNGGAFQTTAAANTYTALAGSRNGNNGNVAEWWYNTSTQVGTISVTSSATAYNTSSDYRLKDNQQPLTGSGAFIDALQPKTWEWKSDGSKGVGFIAHEVQEVSPGSVVGVKDAVNEEGKPIYQAMEYGSAEFIANIIAELQSLRKRLADAGIA